MKDKTLGKARLVAGSITKHLRRYGMGQGVDSANELLAELMEWVYDMGAGKERPCPIDENVLKRRIKW